MIAGHVMREYGMQIVSALEWEAGEQDALQSQPPWLNTKDPHGMCLTLYFSTVSFGEM